MAKKDTVVDDMGDVELDVNALLKLIRTSDAKQVEAQMDIARLLACIKEYKLYAPKYESFKDLVLHELDFAVSAADRYVSFYQHYQSFNYGREEMYKLMRQLGWRKVQLCLRSAKKKMGYRAMVAFLEEHYYAQDRQFNFNLSNDVIAKKLEKALKPFGLKISADGRRSHMTESLEKYIEHVERLETRGKQLDMLEAEDGAATSTRAAKRAATGKPAAKKRAAKLAEAA